MAGHDPSSEETQEAEKAAAEYQNALARAQFEQETQRDKTLVLISGGALTVSFAFISTLVEHGKIIRLWWLIAAWIAWVAVLVLTVVGYTLSIGNYRYVVNALSRGDWANARRTPKLSNYIEPLNVTVSILAVCGFILFGYFAIGTLQRISNDQSQTTGSSVHESPKEGEAKGKPTAAGRLTDTPSGKLTTTPAAGVPEP